MLSDGSMGFVVGRSPVKPGMMLRGKRDIR